MSLLSSSIRTMFTLIGISVICHSGFALAQSADLQEAKHLHYQVDQLQRQNKHQEAIPLAQKALQFYEKSIGFDHPETNLIKAKLALSFKYVGDYNQSEILYNQLLDRARRVNGPRHRTVGDMLGLLASVNELKGDFKSAQNYIVEAISIYEKELGSNDLHLAAAYKKAAGIMEKNSNNHWVIVYFNKCIGILKNVLGQENHQTVEIQNELALFYSNIKDYSNSEKLYLKSIGIYEKIKAPEHPYLSLTMIGLAQTYDKSENYSQAEFYYIRALKIIANAIGPEHPDNNLYLNLLCEMYQKSKNYSAAESIYKQMIHISEINYGANKEQIANILLKLAKFYFTTNNYFEAERLYNRSLKILEKSFNVDHPKVASCLNDFGYLYENTKNYAKAEQMYKRSLSIVEKNFGTEDLNTATLENNLGLLYKKMGKYIEAEKLYKKSLITKEKKLGKDNLIVADNLDNLGYLYISIKNNDDAEKCLKNSMLIKEKILGENNLAILPNLNNLAKLYQEKKNHIIAEEMYKRSLAIAQREKGIDHDDVADILNQMASFYLEIDNYYLAEPLFLKCLAIKEKNSVSDTEYIAAILNNLALTNKNIGAFSKAELLYKRSLNFYEKSPAKYYALIYGVLTNLSGLYQQSGNFILAEIYQKKCLDYIGKTHGKQCAEFAFELSVSAKIYQNIGNFKESESLYKQSLAIIEKLPKFEKSKKAQIVFNFSTLYIELGDYKKAKYFLQQSIAFEEKEHGTSSADLIPLLNQKSIIAYLEKNFNEFMKIQNQIIEIARSKNTQNDQNAAANMMTLSIMACEFGYHNEALMLATEATKIFTNINGPDHPDVAIGFHNIARINQEMENLKEAKSLFIESLEIKEKQLGKKHPSISTNLINLAEISVAQKQYTKAIEFISRAHEIQKEAIDIIQGFNSEDSILKFLNKLKADLYVIMTIAGFKSNNDKELQKTIYEIWLQRKGIVLECMTRNQLGLLEFGKPEEIQIFNELNAIRTNYAEVIYAGPGKEVISTYQRRLNDFRDKKEELEAKLARMSQVYAQTRKVRHLTIEELCKTLPLGSVLVDFARVEVFNFESKSIRNRWMPAHYLAFILRPDRGQDLTVIDIGQADEIDSTLKQFKEAQLHKNESRTKDACRKLHDQVFSPIQKELASAQRVFLSPDGALNLLPFEVMLDSEGKFLIEKYTFNYLAAGRDLVGFGEKKASAERPLLLGDPDFDLNPKQKSQALNRIGIRIDTDVAAVRSSEHRNLPFKRLKETGKEVSAISDLFGQNRCEVFIGESALEEVLQSRKAPRILHLATHGFFLTDQEWSSMGDFRGIGGTVSFTSMEQPFARPSGPRVNLENPLLRSGIALAGANRAGFAGQGSDGILTADEVLGLRLRGTELVVLSACETGLGEVKTGEGVFGLRRAFAQAGARSMVMSMWSVPDRETQELMVEFYKNILSGKLDRCQALRQAALAQKKIVQQRYGQDNPFFWGAFVFLGQPD